MDTEYVIDGRDLEACRPQSNDERMAQWAMKYFSAGFHRQPELVRPDEEKLAA